jgi:nucleoside-diphosphate-sugar epimerase
MSHKKINKVLLTGGTGMVGANLVYRLVKDGHQVFVLTRPSSNRFRFQALEEQVQILFADITDATAVHNIMFQVKPEIVFHVASTPFNPDTFSAEAHFRVNVLGTLHLLEAIKELKDSRLVFTSSAAEYGSGEHLREDSVVQPGTIFGASKAAATLLVQTYARLHDIHAVILRLFTPYGPWDPSRRLIPHTILSALQGQDVPISEGNQERDFIYIDDVVNALIAAATKPVESGSVFNIGSGEGVSVHGVVKLTLKLMGNLVQALFGALPTRSDEIMQMSADITSAREILGWQPQVSLEEGLHRTILWFTEHHSLASQLV